MDQLQKDQDYLQHFWTPQPRDLVQLPSGLKTRIKEVLDGGSQLILDSGEVAFCSELDWVPEPEQFPKVLSDRGFSLLFEEGLVRKSQLLFGYPKDLADLAELIRTDRMVIPTVRRPKHV